ncbi:MAG: transposase [Segetibacter sp.]|nr:transposase [Segetibacter sp.]
MLTEDKIGAIYCFLADLHKGTGRQEDIRRKVSDSEMITSAIVSALYFGGHLDMEDIL